MWMPKVLSRQIVFSGRHTLGICQRGDPGGSGLFYFHGFPGSRLEVQAADTAARRRGIRIIGIDRPGYGLSAAQPGRQLLDWPNDVIRVADHLELETFAVLGVSGGGPYAAACAYQIPQRLTAVGIAGGLGPLQTHAAAASMCRFNRFGLKLAGLCPGLLRPLLTSIRWLLQRRPQTALQFVARRAGGPDQKFFENPELLATMKQSFRESMRFGIEGAADDLRIYSRPWKFSLQSIEMRVHLWHGERDRLVPAAMGRQMSASIAGCRARFFPDEGHFSLIVHRMDQILADLAGA
jgi:pimeloyl-ACP methyl ester carboxylesterase